MLTNSNSISGLGKKFDQSGTLKQIVEIIRKYRPLTINEEYELFEKYHQGDKSAGDKLILHNQGFLFSMAKEYSRNEDEAADYFIEGNIGMKEALDRFDPSYGVKFFTYASHYIRRSMWFYVLKTRDMINQSNKKDIYLKAVKFKDAFYLENGRYPSDEEVLDMLHEAGEDVKNISDIYDVKIVSNDSIIDADEDFKMDESKEYTDKTQSFNEYENDIENDHNKALVMSLLRFVKPNDRKLIMQLYHIGKYSNYTRQQVIDENYLDEISLKKLEDNILEQMRTAYKKSMEKSNAA